MKRLGRWLLRSALGLLALVLLVVIGTVTTVELGCRGEPGEGVARSGSPTLDRPGYRRPEIVSFLSYPEWSIVHAYEDLAAVLARGDESDFRYTASVLGFWRSFCRLNRLGAQYPGAELGDTKPMLYTIGLSFTAELAAKGLYERTLGRLAEAIRGERKTAVDRAVAAIAADYATFLQQTPWYAYPFIARLGDLWAVPRADGDSRLRHIERKLAMSVEFGVKAGYAELIGLAAGSLGPVDRSTQAIFTADQAAADTLTPQAQSIERLDERRVLVRTERYRAFAVFLLRAAQAEAWPLEVAGNTRALITVIVPEGSKPPPEAGAALFTVPLSAHPARERLALDMRLPQWPALLRWIDATPGARFEHFYDY